MSANSVRRRLGTKVCRICGDKSHGYNFNVVTCESCKAFFRRNAVKEKETKCPFDGDCTIDAVTRRFCQSCRLRKCFEVGMKKEWILSEEAKQLKKSKSKKNKPSPNVDLNEEFSIINESGNVSDYVNQIVDNSIANGDFTDITTFCSSPNSPLSSSSGLSSFSNISATTLSTKTANYSLKRETSQLSSVSSNSDQNIESVEASTYQKLSEIEYMLLPARNRLFIIGEKRTTNKLNYLEEAKLNELITANEILNTPISSLCTPESGNGSLVDIVKMTDHAIRKIIQMAKKLDGFRSLCEEDQVALLKGGCTELMVLRSVMSYSTEKDCWLDSRSKILLKLEVLKQGKVNIYEAHKRFITSFDNDWRNDERIMIILSAITLFTPERANLTHKELVRFEQAMYMTLLKRYLESIYTSYCKARSIYIRLMMKLEELHILNEDHVRVYLNINPDIVGPLLIEIFDLKGE